MFTTACHKTLRDTRIYACQAAVPTPAKSVAEIGLHRDGAYAQAATHHHLAVHTKNHWLHTNETRSYTQTWQERSVSIRSQQKPLDLAVLYSAEQHCCHTSATASCDLLRRRLRSRSRLGTPHLSTGSAHHTSLPAQHTTPLYHSWRPPDFATPSPASDRRFDIAAAHEPRGSSLAATRLSPHSSAHISRVLFLDIRHVFYRLLVTATSQRGPEKSPRLPHLLEISLLQHAQSGTIRRSRKCRAHAGLCRGSRHHGQDLALCPPSALAGHASTAMSPAARHVTQLLAAAATFDATCAWLADRLWAAHSHCESSLQRLRPPGLIPELPLLHSIIRNATVASGSTEVCQSAQSKVRHNRQLRRCKQG